MRFSHRASVVRGSMIILLLLMLQRGPKYPKNREYCTNKYRCFTNVLYFLYDEMEIFQLTLGLSKCNIYLISTYLDSVRINLVSKTSGKASTGFEPPPISDMRENALAL